MALHEVNLWTFNSRVGSSLDTTGSYGGLTAGRIDLPVSHKVAKGFKIRVGGTHTVSSFATLALMLTAIGGREVKGTNEFGGTTIEFDTKTTTDGERGIYSVEGIFVKEWHPNDALTKGEAMMHLMTHGVDEYTWDGSEALSKGVGKNLFSLGGISTDVTQGITTINAASLVVLPVSAQSRGLVLTVVVEGDYSESGPHDFDIQLKSADGSEILQATSMYTSSSSVNKSTAHFHLYTNGVHDELSTTGVKLEMVNRSDTEFTLKKVKLVAQNTSNPDFTNF